MCFSGSRRAACLKPEMVKTMAARPLILALANPTPEISPEEVAAVRDDAIMATGRSDYPNQVNNVLCFPYIFRGALDCGATTITDAMEIAAVHAIAELAQAEQSEVVAAAYAGATLSFGPEYLIPKPFDPRLMMRIAPAVAQAAAESGVAQRPIADLDAYREKLQTFVYASGTTMKPIFAMAKRAKARRVVYAEGEDERVLRAVQVVVDEGLARPILVGRPAVIAQRCERFGLRIRPGDGLRGREHRGRPALPRLLADLPSHGRAQGGDRAVRQDRDAPPPDPGRRHVAAQGRGRRHAVRHLGQHGHPSAVHRPGDRQACRRQDLCLHERPDPARPQVFLVDTHVNYDPSAEQIAEITVLAAEELRRYGIRPKAALLSHSNFGTSNQPSALKMRDALALLQQQAPWLEVDGEMHGDTALDASYRAQLMPHSSLQRRGQSAGAAEHRRRQHCLQPAQDGRRRRHRDRADPAGSRQAGAHPDAVDDGATHRQPDGHDRGGCQLGALARAVPAGFPCPVFGMATQIVCTAEVPSIEAKKSIHIK
jgi:malate dehydrogenase (oxaloacetate-decarboxylating)(NADP+)